MKIRYILPSLAMMLVLAGCGQNNQPTNKEYLGNPDAKTDVQIYSDIECPACSRASNFTDVILEEFGDDVKISFHHFPLESIHPHAFGAAVAAECAGEQDALWKYVKYAYKFQDQLDTQSLKKHAVNLGLDTEKFDVCIDNQATAENVKSDLQRALRLGLQGTPSFAINGEVVELGTNPDDMLKMIEESINSAKK